jgi:hypothetical protein
MGVMSRSCLREKTRQAGFHYNRKCGSSVVILAVADSRCCFIYLRVGYSGSMHDPTILRSSPLWHMAEVTHHPYFQQHRLLGDSAYHSTPNWIITPYPDNGLTDDRARFNTRHAKARCCIERAFGWAAQDTLALS